MIFFSIFIFGKSNDFVGENYVFYINHLRCGFQMSLSTNPVICRVSHVRLAPFAKSKVRLIALILNFIFFKHSTLPCCCCCCCWVARNSQNDLSSCRSPVCVSWSKSKKKSSNELRVSSVHRVRGVWVCGRRFACATCLRNSHHIRLGRGIYCALSLSNLVYLENSIYQYL